MSKIDKKEVTEILRAFLILFIIGLLMIIGIKAIIFNFCNWDIVNPKVTIIATYSNNDISNQIKNNKENKFMHWIAFLISYMYLHIREKYLLL